VQAAILTGAGAPPDQAAMQEMQITDTLQGIEKMSGAADHADNLMSTTGKDEEAAAAAEKHTPMTKNVNNASPAKT
jgi:hypothetical protein